MPQIVKDRSRLFIRTPEGITFPLVLAGPFSRCLAWAVDIACILAAVAVSGTVVVLLGLLSMDLAAAAGMVAALVISVGYGILLEWKMRGQTLGKRLLGLRVMDAGGLRLRFPQIVIRNILRLVDILPGLYMAGGLCALVTPKAQRLGDLAAGTIVAARPSVGEPDLAQVLPDKYNSFRDYPHIQARLRQRVSPEEAGVALSALLRRDTLEPAARVALFAELAALFKEKAAFPQEATDGLSDERYVRNVVDVVYR